MYHSRAYDDPQGRQPVLIVVADGTHDVSRLVNALASGTCEQADLAAKIRAQVNRHNGGRAALALLRAHGGPDLLEPVTYPTPTHNNRPTWQWTDDAPFSPTTTRVSPAFVDAQGGVLVDLTKWQSTGGTAAWYGPQQWEQFKAAGDAAMYWATHYDAAEATRRNAALEATR